MNRRGAVDLPIDGVLDLHGFRPREVRDLIPEYLHECRKRGLYRVRIIHGRGTGALRDMVLDVLRHLPEVEASAAAPRELGGWGSTLVALKGPART